MIEKVQITDAGVIEEVRNAMPVANHNLKGLTSIDLFKRSMQRYASKKYIHLCNLQVYYANCLFLIASGSPLGRLPLGMISCLKAHLPEIVSIQGNLYSFSLFYRDINGIREIWGYEGSSGGSLNIAILANHGGGIELNAYDVPPEGLIKV